MFSSILKTKIIILATYILLSVNALNMDEPRILSWGKVLTRCILISIIKVLQLLIVAWKRRLTFTIGTSATTGEDDTVIWNEIHHKTELGTNYSGHGYPDPKYLDNVLLELAVHGITEKDLPTWRNPINTTLFQFIFSLPYLFHYTEHCFNGYQFNPNSTAVGKVFCQNLEWSLRSGSVLTSHCMFYLILDLVTHLSIG